MMTVDLVYDSDCPNVRAARAALLRAFVAAGLTPHWREWGRGDPDAPEEVRAYGSPTVLVNEVDVAPAAPMEGTGACRLYAGRDGALRGAPDVEVIAAALRHGLARRPAGPGMFWAALPSFGVALLPKVACPACWPAYAAVLGSLGLGFLMDGVYLVPIATGALALFLFALGFRARRRRGYGPLALGALAAAAILYAKVALAPRPVEYAGAAFLIAASIWNAWPRGRAVVPRCASCAPSSAVTLDSVR